MARLQLALRLTQLRIAELTGNRNTQQHMLEEIVSLHIRLQLAREQAHNKALFSSI